MSVLIHPSGLTRIEATQGVSGEMLLTLILRDGEPVTYTWRNSLFRLPVAEVFRAEAGRLVLTQVTFGDPAGDDPPVVSPGDIDDLYHTGGPFRAVGLARPFTRIVCRVGEVGDPKLQVRNRSVSFKEAAGFGGQVILTADRPSLAALLLQKATTFLGCSPL
jgi:hypothetical protein